MPPLPFLTHCQRYNPTICKLCTRRGLDCRDSCSECLYLNSEQHSVRARIHHQDEKFTYFSTVLCKQCSLFHIHYSLGADLFQVRIGTDSTKTDYEPSYGQRPAPVSEREKGPYTYVPRNITQHVCTACMLRVPIGGICRVCRVATARQLYPRLWLINGHLQVVAAYCRGERHGPFSSIMGLVRMGISGQNYCYGVHAFNLLMKDSERDGDPRCGENKQVTYLTKVIVPEDDDNDSDNPIHQHRH